LAVPFSMFLQPSKNMDTQTQPLTRMGNLHLFYSKNLGCSKTQTQQKNTKQQSQSPSSSKSTSKTAQSLNKQLPNLSPLPSSLQCVHVSTSKPEQWHTKIIRLHNICFFWGAEQLDHDHPRLEYANCVSVTFERQKRDKKMDTITQKASGDRILCPVRAAAAIVKRSGKYPGSFPNSPVSTVYNNKITDQVTSDHGINAL
jgi:hypothetical protein